jgi:hypothetical protein
LPALLSLSSSFGSFVRNGLPYYAFIGRKEPDFPGGLVPNHASAANEIQVYNAEIAKVGQWTFQLPPYAVDQELTPYSNAAKIRQLFVIPNARVEAHLPPVRDAVRGAGISLRCQLRIQLRHAAIFGYALAHRDAADRRVA